MKFTKLLVACAVFMLSVSSVFAQTRKEVRETEAQDLGYKPYGYGFFQAQGGLSTTFTNVSASKLLSPTFTVGGGYMFMPEFGMRINANGIWAKGGSPDYDDKYSYRYIKTDLDLMFNITNMFRKRVHRLFDLYFIAGVGFTHAWDNDDANMYAMSSDYVGYFDNVDGIWGGKLGKDNFWGHNYRLGFLGDFNIAKHWSVGAEIDVNNTEDRFNSKMSSGSDWTLTAQLSLTYKFGFRKYKPKSVPVTTNDTYSQAAAEAEAARLAAEKAHADEAARIEAERQSAESAAKVAQTVKVEPLREVVHFKIGKSSAEVANTVAKIAEWNRKYPNSQILVSGYADKGTGTSAVNGRISALRSKSVVDALINSGVPASRIKSEAYGDTVQPFTVNDENRCVIIVGGE